MTIDEAIAHCLEVAEQNEAKAQKIGVQFLGTIKDREATECRECAADHRQLAEWLTELKDLREENKVLISECDRLIKEKGELLKKSEQIAKYKSLLKAAVEDIQDMLYQVDSVTVCTHCIHTNATCYGGSDCEHEAKWTHLDEALALIGEDGEQNDI